MKRPNRYPGQKRHEYRAPDENFQPHVQVYQADGIQGDIGAPVIVQNDRGKEQKDGAKQIIDKKAGQHPLLSDTAEHADNHKQRQQHRFEKDIKRENVRRGEKTGNHADKHQGKNHQRLAVFFVVSGAEHTDQNGGMHGRNKQQRENVHSQNDADFRVFKPLVAFNHLQPRRRNGQQRKHPPNNQKIGHDCKNADIEDIAPVRLLVVFGRQRKQQPDKRNGNNRRQKVKRSSHQPFTFT